MVARTRTKMRPLHNTPSAASLSRFGLGHVRKHTPFALTLSSLHLGHSAKSLPKKRCFFGERPFCKGLLIYTTPIGGRSLSELSITSDTLAGSWGLNRLCLPGVVGAAPLRHLGYEESTPSGVRCDPSDPSQNVVS